MKTAHIKRSVIFLFGFIVLLCSCSRDGESQYLHGASPDEEDDNAAITVKIATVIWGMNDNEWQKEFEAAHKGITLEVKRYYDINIPFDEALTSFNLDIIAGNIPDVIINENAFFHIRLPVESYINKGLLTDLYPLMDNDPNFSKSDYLPNSFAAMQRNGKLYEVFSKFYVDTIIAKTSETGTSPGWTLDEFAAYVDSKPEARYIVDIMTRESFVVKAAHFMFADKDDNSFKFDREKFSKLLRVAERFPAEEPHFGFEFFDGARIGDPIMLNDGYLGGGYFTNARAIRLYEQVYFGEEITFKGYPDTDGAYFLPENTVSITEKSTRKEAAWEFVKYFLNKPIGEQNVVFTTNIKQLEEVFENAKRDPYGYDEDGNKVTQVFSSNRQDGSIPAGNNTDEDNKKVMELLQSLDYRYTADSTIIAIFGEELAPYFAGQKTADQVAEVIESRVNIYLSETSP